MTCYDLFLAICEASLPVVGLRTGIGDSIGATGWPFRLRSWLKGADAVSIETCVSL